MKIAILGGSFDPPHKGHAILAKRLVRLLGFDEVWLVPCYKHPFGKKLSAVNHRFEMTKYLEDKNIKVSRLELERRGISYAIDTLKHLAKDFPRDELFFVIGSDQVRDFPKWKEWKEVTGKFKLIIIPRNGMRSQREIAEILKRIKFKKNTVIVDKKKFPQIPISSSDIRRKIKEGKSISKLVPKSIGNYIVNHKLYLT